MIGGKLFQVDAFTDTPFRGNPAGVCLPHQLPPVDWMQAFAAEMNLSETAFIQVRERAVHIRYFTPLVEVPLCGHATLASAHVLWELGAVARERVTLHTPKGPVRAWPDGDWICLDFPVLGLRDTEPPPPLTKIVGRPPVRVCEEESGGYLVELASEADVRAAAPDLAMLREAGLGRLTVTARSATDGSDFVSRFFWPAAGIDEDPVTGMAHCALGPYWAARLGRTSLVGRQVSRRTGLVHVTVGRERVTLSGHAVTVFAGEISV